MVVVECFFLDIKNRYMKIRILFFLVWLMLGIGHSVWSQLATWDVFNNGAEWTVSPFNPTISNPNIMVTGLVKGSGLGNLSTSANYSFGGSGADQSTLNEAINNNDFFTMSLKAKEGYTMSITGIPTWFTRRSNSQGTCLIVVQYSLDGENFNEIGSISVDSSSSPGGSTPLVFPPNIQTELSNLSSTIIVTLRFVVVSSNSRNIYIVTGSEANNTNRFQIGGFVSSDNYTLTYNGNGNTGGVAPLATSYAEGAT